jgi:uncharacterized protein
MKNFNAFDWVALSVLVVGGVNWGLVGAFNIDLVSTLFGDMTVITRVIYSAVGLSALYIVLSALYTSSTISSSQVVYP